MRVITSENYFYDFCQDHRPRETLAKNLFDSGDEGPDGRGNCYAYDAEHPPYDRGEYYYCFVCGELLGDGD